MENYYHMLFPDGSSASSPKYSSSLMRMANHHQSYMQGNDMDAMINSTTTNKVGNNVITTTTSHECDEDDHLDAKQQVVSVSSQLAGKVKVGKKLGDNKGARKHRYAFQTRSQVDILDDGYRWRKYGQKTVKNGKFPRSYYRCTHKDCNVKKQVQRSSKDDEIVVTTYEGIHTHPVEKLVENFDHILRQMHTYNPL